MFSMVITHNKQMCLYNVNIVYVDIIEDPLIASFTCNASNVTPGLKASWELWD